MADKTIKQLTTEVTTISTDDWFVIQKDADNETAKIKAENIYANQYFTNKVAFRAYRSGSKTVSTSFVDIVHDTEHFDIGGNFDTSTGIFTAPVGGLYILQTQMYVAGVSTTRALCEFSFTGTYYAAGTGHYLDFETTRTRKTGNYEMAYMANGATVKVRGYSVTSADVASEGTWFAGCLIGAISL
jgi:hypothetical protein